MIAGRGVKLLGVFRQAFCLAVRTLLRLARFATLPTCGGGRLVAQDNGLADFEFAPIHDLGLRTKCPLQAPECPSRDPQKKPWSASSEEPLGERSTPEI